MIYCQTFQDTFFFFFFGIKYFAFPHFQLSAYVCEAKLLKRNLIFEKIWLNSVWNEIWFPIQLFNIFIIHFFIWARLIKLWINWFDIWATVVELVFNSKMWFYTSGTVAGFQACQEFEFTYVIGYTFTSLARNAVLYIKCTGVCACQSEKRKSPVIFLHTDAHTENMYAHRWKFLLSQTLLTIFIVWNAVTGKMRERERVSKRDFFTRAEKSPTAGSRYKANRRKNFLLPLYNMACTCLRTKGDSSERRIF